METIYKGQRFTVYQNSRGFFIDSTEGKHYCNDNYCQYCEISTPDLDAHRFYLDFPEEDFRDDLGNEWIFYGEIRRDESSSFGWWESTSRWYCKTPRFADPIDIKKIRRRIEDALRKADEYTILRVAESMNIRQD